MINYSYINYATMILTNNIISFIINYLIKIYCSIANLKLNQEFTINFTTVPIIYFRVKSITFIIIDSFINFISFNIEL